MSTIEGSEVRRRVICLAIIERGWRVLSMYAIGFGVLFAGAIWLQHSRFSGAGRDMIALPSVVTVLTLWKFLGSARLELSDADVGVRKSGLLDRANRIPYARIQYVEVLDSGMELWMNIIHTDGNRTEIGPMRSLLVTRYRQRVDAARAAIELGIERSKK